MSRPVYVADFETCDDRDFHVDGSPREVRVWAWCVTPLDRSVHWFGDSIRTFLEYCATHPGIYYFHNLAFDGTHILDALLRDDYKYADLGKKRACPEKSFATLISDTGKFYSLKVNIAGAQIEYRDSLKKLPFSVAAIAKAWQMPIAKGEIDYRKWRGLGYVMTDEERDYIARDVDIVAAALETELSQGHDRLTIGSDCLTFYKEMLGKSAFRRAFPSLNAVQDAFVRSSYRGGYVRVEPVFAGVDVGPGISVDRNSMYPSEMVANPYPVGRPRYFSGRYREIPGYPLYVQNLTVAFHMKRGGFPMLQLKNAMFGAHEYVERCDEPISITLTSVDLETFFDNYEVDVWEWGGGLAFQQESGLFDEYIAHWMNIKETSTGALRQLAKLFLTTFMANLAPTPASARKNPRSSTVW